MIAINSRIYAMSSDAELLSSYATYEYLCFACETFFIKNKINDLNKFSTIVKEKKCIRKKNKEKYTKRNVSLKKAIIYNDEVLHTVICS